MQLGARHWQISPYPPRKGLSVLKDLYASQRGEKVLLTFKVSKVNALRKRRRGESFSLFSIEWIKTLIFNFYLSLHKLFIYCWGHSGSFQFGSIINFCCLQHSCTWLLYVHISDRHLSKNEVSDHRYACVPF